MGKSEESSSTETELPCSWPHVSFYTESALVGAVQEVAEGRRKGCPVSKALAGTEISLTAKLV